ncbi:hypothetical protein PQR25_36785 [Paraburkholderia nemoris]|uniref:hypothetical protein n=1 Tax=Paraburkholderia nemoris TaxID=2793076 RepID=UPI0038BA959C
MTRPPINKTDAHRAKIGSSDMPEVHNLEFGTVQSFQLIYFTGGLLGRQTGNSWTIGPMLRDGRVVHLGPVPDGQVPELAKQLGVSMLGTSQITLDDPNLPFHIWTPIIGRPSGRFAPADRWGLISNNARAAHDEAYANLARYVEVSLRAADIRLRDAADHYHRQLFAALHRGQSVDLRFKNISEQDLHAAFHSLLAELGAARDYLSSITAREVDGADTSVDSLARLVAWTNKQANKSARQHPDVALLLEGMDEGANDRWMHELTQYRNAFLHREPLGARSGDNWLIIAASDTQHGPVHMLRFNLPRHAETDPLIDALDKFVHLYSRMQGLAGALADRARYPDTPVTFVAASPRATDGDMAG